MCGLALCLPSVGQPQGLSVPHEIPKTRNAHPTMEQLIHILHLEDDPVDAELIQAKIEAAGLACQICCVKTRDEFEAELRQGGYDVILADFQLPMYDGMSALRLAQELRPDIPFIFVSGTMGEDAVIESLTEGATDYVLKQRLSRLVSAIPRALHEAENRRERRRAEDELRKLSQAVEQSANTIIITDTQGHIEYVNPRFIETTGYTLAEVQGQHTRILKSSHTPPEEYQQLWEIISTGKEWRGEFLNKKKSGELYWESALISPIKTANGTITHFLAVKEDITERKQAEEEHHRAEIEQKQLLAQIQKQAQQVQNIIDTVPEGVILLRDDQSITLTNPVAEKFLTLLAPEWKNGYLTHLGQRPLNTFLTSPPKGMWHEITNAGLVFETIARPVENSPDNGGWVLVLRDVTQERDIQQRVHQQERLAAVGQLAAGIAHDFNNILAVISLYSQLILRTVEMPVHAQEQLQTIEQQIKRAADLIQQVLDFSRQSILERQPCDLLPFMKKLVALLERTLPEHIQIELTHADDAYFIQADPSRMQQVVMNLAVNARDAMPEGGLLRIRLAHLHTQNPTPTSVQDLPPGNWIQIEVADSGSGIPPQALTHIFEPFYTTKEKGRGTGLGLAQVYGIVQQHEGYIDVVTQVGQGTTFVLYFPALNTDVNVMDMPDKSELRLGRGQKILLVEDDPVTRGALFHSLTLLNYEAMVAANGREALAILATKADEVELILSDTIMPEMGGIALFHAIKKQNLPIPVVLLTGHPLSKEMENLQSLGLAGWLPKPPDLINLSCLLAEALAD